MKVFSRGDWVLVTGASGGIGKDLSCLFARDGFNLVLVARKKDDLVAVASDLAKQFSIKTACKNYYEMVRDDIK